MQTQTEELTEEDLRLIQERESAIMQLEVHITVEYADPDVYSSVSDFHMNHLSLCCSTQADITDINDIFKDLGMMVHEQGDMIGELLSL